LGEPPIYFNSPCRHSLATNRPLSSDVPVLTGADGGFPYAGVIRDSTGNLYGTAPSGGTDGWGLVYKLDAASNFKALYDFTGGADGGG